MSQTDARSMEQIRRDAERARADLTDTVQQLRDSVSGAASDVRQRFSPESIKEDLLGAARRNPLQAAAVGALVAWPAMRIARSIPLPVLMIGAGLFLTGSRTGQDLSRKAVERASDLAGEARRKAHDLTDAASDAAAAHRWIEAISGKTGQSLWVYELPKDWFELPANMPIPYLMRWFCGSDGGHSGSSGGRRVELA